MQVPTMFLSQYRFSGRGEAGQSRNGHHYFWELCLLRTVPKLWGASKSSNIDVNVIGLATDEGGCRSVRVRSYLIVNIDS